MARKLKKKKKKEKVLLGKIKNPHWRKAWRWGLFSFSSQTLGNFLLPVQSKRNKLRECVKWWIVVLVSQKVKMRRLCSHLCLCSVLVYFLSLHFIVHLPETDFFFFWKEFCALISVYRMNHWLALPIFYFENTFWTSLAVQLLRLPASTSRAQVQSLVGELRSCMPHGTATKKKTNKQTKKKQPNFFTGLF